LEPLFDRAAEVQEHLTALSRVKTAVERAGAAGDPLYAEANPQAVLAALATAYDALKATIPYAVCPYCKGKPPMVSSCRACQHRGAVGKFRYDNAIPESAKK
jgi:hypothetical protein